MEILIKRMKIFEKIEKSDNNMSDNEDLDMDSVSININEWKTPATEYPEKEFGSVRIRREFYNWGYFNNYGVRGYKLFNAIKQIPVTSLEIKYDSKDRDRKSGDNRIKYGWETWMVDDPPHYWSMQDYAAGSMGRVLVAGLGLGLVLWGLSDNVDVDSVTVVETNKDVINLVGPLLPKMEDIKFRIINKDFYEFINETSEQFDRIIIDLWTTSCIEETRKVYREEVVPLSFYIKKLFPDASVVFHGFGLEW